MDNLISFFQLLLVSNSIMYVPEANFSTSKSTLPMLPFASVVINFLPVMSKIVAPHQPPRAQQEARRHLFRAELRRHARGGLLTEEAARCRAGAGREERQGGLVQPHAGRRSGPRPRTLQLKRKFSILYSPFHARPTSSPVNP